MLDFLRPTEGGVTVFGMVPRDDAPAIHARTGYVPGEFGLYERMHVRAYLEAFAAFRDGVGREQIDPLAERLVVDLERPIHELSHGNKQKVGLIQAFMHEPELLVLDEPTQGLDPLVQQTFYELVDETRARGGTVFLSSHILPEVERTCDRVGIIREGRLLTVDDVGDLKAKALRSIVFHFSAPVDSSAFASLPSVVSAQAHGDTIELSVRGELDEVVKEAARHTVVNVETREPSLEEIFLRAYRDGGDT
jgi:ABC-2 type transport system ATP-binding protein